MSWSISLLGKPKNVVATLQAESSKLSGQSKEEYDAALPHLIGLVEQTMSDPESPNQVVDLDASGHATFQGNVIDGEKKKVYSNCNVSLKSFSKRIVLLLAMLSLCFSPAMAQEEVHLNITDLAPGTYKLTKDAQGVVKLVPLRVIQPNGQPNNPNPPPKDETFDEAITRFTREAISNGGSKTTGAGLSSVYSLVSSSVSDGSIAPDKAFAAVKKASDSVLNIQSDGAKWTVFRDSVGKALTALSATGGLHTDGALDKNKVASVLNRIAASMNVVTGFGGNPIETSTLDPATTGILEGIDLAKLIEIIKIILELMKTFK